MAKYIITGKNGTLASEFRNLLSTQAKSFSSNELDITNKEHIRKIINEERPQFLVNCAAYTNVDLAESETDKANQINGTALSYLSEACNEFDVTLIHFSSGMVFPGDNPSGYNEDDLPNPVNAYGRSKLLGEQYIQKLAEKFYIIRTSWLYGKAKSDTAKKSFIDIMISLGKNGKVKGVSDEIGSPTWTYDLVLSTKSLIENQKPYGIYHITNQGSASRLEWAKEIYKILNMQVEVEPVLGDSFPREAKRGKFELLNNNKLQPLPSWQEALTQYLNS